MAKKYLDSAGLTYLWGKLKSVFVLKTRKINGKTLETDIVLSASDVGAANSTHTHDNYCTKSELNDAINELRQIIDNLNLGFANSEDDM